MAVKNSSYLQDSTPYFKILAISKLINTKNLKKLRICGKII